MCFGCWEEQGRPQVNSEAVSLAARTVAELYTVHLVGGKMHIVTDDWNVEDEDVEFCKEEIEKDGDELERACLAAFLALTQTERASALALERGFYTLNENTP